MCQPSNHFQGYLEGVMTSGKMGMSMLASEINSYGNGISPDRVSHQMNFSRQSSSPTGMLTQLSIDIEMPEIVDKINMNMGCPFGESFTRCSSDSTRLGNVGQGQGYISSLSTRSWEDGTMLSRNYEGIQNGTHFSTRKQGRDIDEKMILGLNLPENLVRFPSFTVQNLVLSNDLLNLVLVLDYFVIVHTNFAF